MSSQGSWERKILEGLESIKVTDGNLSVVQDLPTVRTKIQTEFLHRDMLLLESMKDLVAEQRRTNFLLELISGVDIDAEDFEND